ncbi:MAG: MBL fold metallo-hydrolase [Treponema sp.]|nr:MBL fold metallo-hydrolase [Treponema sp.]
MRITRRRRRNAKNSKSLFILLITLCSIIAAWHYASANLQGDAPAGIGASISIAEGSVIVHFIDVGQGDATLIQTDAGNVLIDGGDRRTADDVVRYLHNLGVDRFSYIIATHPHADHIAGLINVINTFNVDTIIMPRVAHTTVTFERLLDAIETNDVTVREPAAGSSFTLGTTVFTIVAPNTTGYRNMNNYSVSVRAAHGSIAFLFTGDAEIESENEMLERNRNLSAQVLHVGHHGSNSSTTQAFLDAVSPEIAVISLGAGNSYGHPHAEVVNRLEEAGAAIYRTDIHGTIVMSTDGTSVIIH